MPRTWRVVALVGCLGGLIAPSQALAVVIVPPGKGGANQYFEVVPTAHGNTAPPGAGPGGSGEPSGSSLPSLGQGGAGAAAISRLGAQGKAAAALARATAPQPAATGGQVRGLRLNRTQGGSAAGALADALGGAGGLGVLFPALLAVALLAAVMVLVLRVRRGGRPPELGA